MTSTNLQRSLTAVVALLVVVIVTPLLVYSYWVNGLGLDGYVTQTVSKETIDAATAKVIATGQFQRGKTVWDWVVGIILPGLIPLSIAWFAERARRNDQMIAHERTERERELNTDSQRELALQTYLNDMSTLLLKEHLLSQESHQISQDNHQKEARAVARAKTLTTLRRIDGERRGAVLRFLHEAELIQIKDPVVELHHADLSGADLRGEYLHGADLQKVFLREVDLRGAILENVDLRGAYLFRAILRDTDLRGAILDGTNLHEAHYDRRTQWPPGFPKESSGAINDDDQKP